MARAMSAADDVAAVRRYHERSTHQVRRFAPGPGWLDWANQPDPFRTYGGAPIVELPLASPDLEASWEDLHRSGGVRPRSLDRSSLGAFLEMALGLTAWKEYRGSRWALRANPSSGNLHPTEGYLLLREVPGVPAGLHHYVSRDHVLERRFTPSAPAAARLEALLPGGCFLVGLASIHWREAWKYGERAFRYCQHDAGHALATVRYAAAVLGWSAGLLEAPGDADVAAILGLDRDSDLAGLDPGDREHPDALVLVGPPAALEESDRRQGPDLDGLLEALRDGVWAGRPNVLSAEHVAWPAINAAAEAAAKPRTTHSGGGGGARVDLLDAGAPGGPGRADVSHRAVDLIRRRRSAVDMDGATSTAEDVFFGILARLLPRSGGPPLDVLPWRPLVHLLLFVHRVEGLAPGLYVLARGERAVEELRGGTRPSFAWTRPSGCPPSLPLFLLEEGDARDLAQSASCRQAIASDSAFSLGMLAVFDASLQKGAWWYRRLFWECGVVGQVLYMEAEASGLRATGIGCYFDDLVHDVVGIADTRLRDLYHFTVGGAVEDPRLTTLSAYPESVARRS
jgi:SagB-type dehydrogenase family enzyme